MCAGTSFPTLHGERNAGHPCDRFILGADDVLRPT
jgi:hypothetical protein